MIPARGPQTKFLYDLCCAILGVPHTYVALGRHFGMRLCIGMGLSSCGRALRAKRRSTMTVLGPGLVLMH